MLSTCTEPGCTTLVLGVGACLAHQTTSLQEFARGRPFVRVGVPVEAAAGPSSAPRVERTPLSFERRP